MSKAQTLEEHKKAIADLNKMMQKVGKVSFDGLKEYFFRAVYIVEDFPNGKERKLAWELTRYVKANCKKLNDGTKNSPYSELYWNCLKLESRHLLDSYCIYVERNRPAKEKFYMPRRKCLINVVNMYQKLEDDELDECFIHQSPRTGKTGIATMAEAWHISRNMESSNLYATYKESLGGAFIDGVVEICTDPTYCHQEIFPEFKIVYTDAKNHKLDLGRKKKYATLSGKGLESGLNGEYDCNGWLLIDDILEGIQDVLSPDILKRKQIIFDNNLMSRKKEGAKVIYNGTIWSLHDIFSNRLDFIKNSPSTKNIRCEILKIPALDPVTDESNFDYDYGVGFSTEYYRTLRSKFEMNEDMASWFAQYQQQPIERDGAVFNPENMMFYNGMLPSDEEPVRVCAALDVALGGLDYLSMPIAYIYENGDIYIHDVVFSNAEKDITQPAVVNKCIENGVGSLQVENNAAGSMYKDEIAKMFKDQGYQINITGKWSTGTGVKGEKAKQQRIWDKAPEIRKLYFREDGCRSPEYRKFMMNLFAFTINGSNKKHDDAPDSLAMLVAFINGTGATAKVSAVMNPFKRRG